MKGSQMLNCGKDQIRGAHHFNWYFIPAQHGVWELLVILIEVTLSLKRSIRPKMS